MRFLCLGAAGLLAGCAVVTTTTTTTRTIPQSASGSCGAAEYAGLVGQDAAASLAVPEPKRVYVVGDPVTSDFNPDRINIQLDGTDTIVAVTCG